MLINFIKFIHILFTLALLGSTTYCLIVVSSRKFSRIPSVSRDTLTFLNRMMLWCATFAILTGTLLVYPKHFTFHTPWIQTAYVLVFILGSLVSILLAVKKKQRIRWLWWSSYAFLLMILIAIVHDAVTKTTFLF